MTLRTVLAFAFFAAPIGAALADEVAVPAAGPSDGPRPFRPHTANVVAPMPQPPQPPPPLPPPPPPPEIAKQGKLLAGAYTCKGNRSIGSGASTPLVSTLAVKLDLDNAWISAQWTEKTSKLADYRTFDPTAQLWTRFQLISDGRHATLTSLGEKAGEWVWEGPEQSAHGTIQMRHHEKLAGKELKLWGEALLGGTWQKAYDTTCKR